MDTYRQAIAAESRFSNKRFCTSCRNPKEPLGGIWIYFNKGRNRRWKCKECRQAIKKE